PPAFRLLVVDDNPEAAETLAKVLRAAGHEVAIALDGKSAVEAAQKDLPQVALVDIGLPDIDGCEVARRLRKIPNLNGAVLVAVTGYGQEEDRRRSKEAGFDYHLTKPVDPAELERLLATVAKGE